MMPIALGHFQIHILSGGMIQLDPGGVFGTLPHTEWDQTWPVQGNGSVRLALNLVLVKTPRELILIDTGVGQKMDRDQAQRYGIVENPCVREQLAGLGYAASDISRVILTHLHYDHAGGATRRPAGREIILTYPQARYCVNRWEWQAAQQPDMRSAAGYLTDNWQPLKPQLELTHGRMPVTMGVTVWETGGHTRGHQAVLIESGGRKMMVWGDVLPTTTHLNPARVMAFDLFPLETMQFKQKILPQAASEKWLNVFSHDPRVPIGSICQTPENYFQIQEL